MHELAKQYKFAEAAALKEQIVKLQCASTRIKELQERLRTEREAQLRVFLQQGDYNGAATVKKRIQEVTEEIEKFLRIPDVLGAVERLEEVYAGVASDFRAAEEEMVAKAAEAERQEKCKSLEIEIERRVQEEDYEGAAKCFQEKRELLEEAKDTRRSGDANYIPTPQRTGTRSNDGAWTGRQEQATLITIADLQAVNTIIPRLVNLQSVRVLSFSKVSSVPGNTAKGKNKGQASKGKSKTKSKNGTVQGQGKIKHVSKGKSVDTKDAKTSKDNNDRQDGKWMYVGQDGYVIGIGVFGEDVNELNERLQGCLIDVHALRPRAGQFGTIYWSEASKIVRHPEDTDAGYPKPFAYDVSTVTRDFATMTYIQETPKEEFVALVLRPRSVEERVAATGERFLAIHGYDMDGMATGPIRLWRHETDDVIQGNIYIIRGLKVTEAWQWSDEELRYKTKTDGSKTVELTFRTAIEDVTEVADIAQFF